MQAWLEKPRESFREPCFDFNEGLTFPQYVKIDRKFASRCV